MKIVDHGNDGMWKTLRVYTQSFDNSDGVINIPTIPTTTYSTEEKEGKNIFLTGGVNFRASRGVIFRLSLRPHCVTFSFDTLIEALNKVINGQYSDDLKTEAKSTKRNVKKARSFTPARVKNNLEDLEK